jgi:uncharacterized protein involved in cysteine biosynthesis
MKNWGALILLLSLMFLVVIGSGITGNVVIRGEKVSPVVITLIIVLILIILVLVIFLIYFLFTKTEEVVEETSPQVREYIKKLEISDA